MQQGVGAVSISFVCVCVLVLCVNQTVGRRVNEWVLGLCS